MKYINLALFFSFLAVPAFAIETCFSPIENCAEKVETLVKNAKETVDMAAFDLNLPLLVESLGEAKSRTKVRVLVDARQAKGKYSGVKKLRDLGIEVRIGHQKGLMHDKFIIVDGKTLETGSFNYTRHAANANRENMIILTDEAVLKRYSEEFEHIWRTAK